ncbi:HD domain protein [Peptococcaceae bacterium CEB3]|nr:HD domain protein [Peptococcaceae bacterium CEB3]
MHTDKTAGGAADKTAGAVADKTVGGVSARSVDDAVGNAVDAAEQAGGRLRNKSADSSAAGAMGVPSGVKVTGVPTAAEARLILAEAERLNPGPWVQHSIVTAEAARNIACHHRELDPETAYVFGCLHDIGRRTGVSHLRHTIDGYKFMNKRGYEGCARICLTHSFPLPDLESYSGNKDCTADELTFLRAYVGRIHYTLYDELIQLCDSLVTPQGFCLLEKRMVDVALRYGVNELTVPKWQAVFALKQKFEDSLGCSVYELLPGIAETTFR